MLALPIVDSTASCPTPKTEEGNETGQARLLPNHDAADPVRTQGRYCLVTLGCPKNLVDSERMAGLLGLDGYEMVREPEGSDFIVVNTCAFIGDSRSESHAVIREM